MTEVTFETFNRNPISQAMLLSKDCEALHKKINAMAFTQKYMFMQNDSKTDVDNLFYS